MPRKANPCIGCGKDTHTRSQQCRKCQHSADEHTEEDFGEDIFLEDSGLNDGDCEEEAWEW